MVRKRKITKTQNAVLSIFEDYITPTESKTF